MTFIKAICSILILRFVIDAVRNFLASMEIEENVIKEEVANIVRRSIQLAFESNSEMKIGDFTRIIFISLKSHDVNVESYERVAETLIPALNAARENMLKILKNEEELPNAVADSFEDLRKIIDNESDALEGMKKILERFKQEYSREKADKISKECLFKIDEFLATWRMFKKYDKLSKRNIDKWQIWFNRGVAAANLGLYEESLNSFEKALQLNPSDADIWFNRGLVLMEMERYDEAIESFRKAASLDPNLSEAWFNLGGVLLKLGRLEEALLVFDKVLRINPNDADAWFNKGLAYARQNNLVKAIECFNKVLDLNPLDARAWSAKGASLAKMERYNEAMDAFQRSIKIETNNAYAWYNLGLLNAKLGLNEKAIECFKKAIENDPGNARAWVGLGAAFSRLGRIYLRFGRKKEAEKNFREAIKYFEEAIKVNPSLADGWYYKGLVHLELNEIDKAQECLEKLKTLDKNKYESIFKLLKEKR